MNNSAELTIVGPKRPYSPQEDALIRLRVSETPNNISYACEIAASEMIGRNGPAVQARYYAKLREDTSKVTHSLSSNKGYVHNVKNTPRPKPTETEVVDPMTVILENFSRLTQRQAKAILEIFGGNR